MQIPKLSVDNYQFTIVIFLLLTIFGISSFLRMPRSENPVVYIPGAGILVVYPGSSPVDLEELIARPIEEAVNELDDIKKIKTSIQEGFVYISVEFSYETDAQEKFDEVVQKINNIRSDLPDDMMQLDINQYTSTDVAILQYALVSDSAEPKVLEYWSGQIKKQLEKVSGVRKVEEFAIRQQEIRVSLDLESMAQMNIPVDQVINAIQSTNANIPGGSIDLGDNVFSIKTSGSYNNLREIKNTIVHTRQGKIVYLKNIADVNFDYQDEKYLARYQGHNALFFTVLQKEGYNIFHIMSDIHESTNRIKKQLPSDISLQIVFNQSNLVDDRINGFLGNLLQGIIIVGVLIVLSLGFKSSLIVITAIPLSIIIGLGFVDISGFGLQQISIAGLVVALGLLVDNSIVIVENINRFRDMGYSPRDAAIKGTSQIGWPVISATLTTLLAFIPIIMMPDKAGDFIRSLPVTIIATLSISLFIALTLNPMLATMYFTKPHQTKTSNKNIFSRLLSAFITGPYRKTIRFALNNNWLIISSTLFLLLLSVFLFRYVGISFFPKAEQPQFMIRANLPPGTNLKKTDQVARYIVSVLDTMPDVKRYATNVGHGNPRIYYNVFPKNYSKNFADIYVELYEYEVEKFDQFISQLRNFFRDYVGAKINIKEFEQGVPIEAPVVLYIIGQDLDELKRIAADAERFIRETQGTINIENHIDKVSSNLFVNIDKDRAGMYGVPVSTIDKTIRMAMNGMSVSNYRDKKGKEYDIVLRLPVGEKTSINDFEKIYIQSLSGRMIPLGQLAEIEFRKAPGIISHYNLDRNATITADIQKGYTLDEVIAPVKQKLNHYNFPPGYSYYIAGELESRKETFGGMQRAIVIAIIAIFAVLVLQFKSFFQPLIIFVAVPLAIIGSVFALLIAGYTFSFTAFIGLISLVGIVVNNSIILVEYTNQLVSDGKTIFQALQEAGETRFTPIILTTLTTIGGLLPLTLQGGTLWAPMGWTIIGGLLVSTFLTLVVIPVLYHVVYRIKHVNNVINK